LKLPDFAPEPLRSAAVRLPIAALAVGLTLAVSACGSGQGASTAQYVQGADPSNAATDFRHYGCVSCHVIPGINGAVGEVGPPLTALGVREYIGGKLPNTATNLEYWLRKPQQIDPDIDMPDMGVTKKDARDMAAYLESLR